MKKSMKRLIEISFLLSLALLGKFELGSFELGKYQIIVTVFWATGILKFMDSNSGIKAAVFDSINDLLISLAIIPLWYWVSGNIENDLLEPTSILSHYAVLVLIMWITKKSVELSGNVAYYTHAVIPVITIILIKLGIPIYLSMIIAVIIPEPINYFYYKKKRRNNN